MRTNQCGLWLSATLVTVALAGCSRSPPVTFYTLTEIPSTATSARPAAAYEVVVNPVTLPETLDRPQLVTRVTDTRVDVLEQQRWAAPLKNEVPRVVAANLNQLLDDAAVTVDPQPATARPRLVVAVEIQRFTATPGSDVTIEALWSVQGAPGTEPKIGYSVLREPVAGPGYDALVAAHAGAIAGLSRDLAAAIRAVRSAAVPAR